MGHLELCDGRIYTARRNRNRGDGAEREYHLQVSEPEPGRVLAEADQRSGLVTTFTVIPENARRARVRIATDWNSAPGLAGMIERWITPPMMRRLVEYLLRIPR